MATIVFTGAFAMISRWRAKPDVIQFCTMGRTLTVRIDDDLDRSIKETARKRGISMGKVVRDQLAAGREKRGERSFMRLAGALSGPRDLSTRKGFSKK